MTSRKLVLSILAVFLCALFAGVRPAAADSSHARIIRLSLVQGDVRFTRDAHGDPLASSSAVWEKAPLNLPIRQGYVISTDNGRAEVEFENGAMAFLKENTVLEFYDLSLDDGARTTRLILRQGSASFYVNPQTGDYFTVTGGDFTVEANGRSSFRLDNYDDGSSVETLKGHVSVLHKDKTMQLEKGQSFSMKAGDESSVNVGNLGEDDDFDRWVSGRVDSVSTATNAALQYTSSSYYAPGFADLYTYGAFSSCGSYGFGWRPFGVGASWSPFTGGQWLWDTGFGWTWMSSQPWGWAPYHYGGWAFDASCGGWFYCPPAYYGVPRGGVNPRGFPRGVHPPQPVYRPVTGVFVRNGGKLGIVPMHPSDQKGKNPLNLEHGVFAPLPAKGMSEQMAGMDRGQKWQPLKSAPRDALTGSLVATGPPSRVSKSMVDGNSGSRVVPFSKDSSIAYDPRERRFVNSNSSVASSTSVNAREFHSGNGQTGTAAGAPAGSAPARATVPSATRGSSPAPPSRSVALPPAPRYSGSGGGSTGGGGTQGGSTYSGNGGSSARSSTGSSSAPASHPSAGRPH